MSSVSDLSPTGSLLLYSSAALSAFAVLYYGYHRYRGGNTCPPDRLNGRVVVLTGATSGIGKATAEELVQRGAVVVLACRDLAAANKLALNLTSQAESCNSLGRATAMLLDLSSLDSVRTFVNLLKEDYTKIDILINNAAVWGSSSKRVFTKDGHEEHFQVNHLAPLALSLLTLPLLRKSEDARIIFVSSGLYKRGALDFDNLNSEKSYNPFAAYSNSKLFQVLCCQEFARLLKNSKNVGIFAVHPGVVNTNLSRNAVRNPVGKFFLCLAQLILLKTPKQGAQPVLYCAIAKKLQGESGKFYGNCHDEPLKTEISRDKAAAKRIWDISLQKIGLANYQF